MRKRLIDSSYLARYLILNAVDIEDYRDLPGRTIENAEPAWHFMPAQDREAVAPILKQAIAARSPEIGTQTADEYLERNATSAFLVIQHDRLLFERYYNGCARDSICTSFSVAKSFVSALIGIALHERLIHSLDDPVCKYLPELKAPFWTTISLRHLLSMSSGLAFTRAGFPWSDHMRIYYSLDLRDLARRAKVKESPGIHFHYNNYNLVLLGMLLERVTGGHVCAYLQDRLWKPLGMEWPATWTLDSERCGMERMESGLNARALDFAKFGRLYLHGGEWNGRQVVPEAWVTESTAPWPDGRWDDYRYLWWIPRAGRGRFMALGSLGQYIYVAPDKDCVILRFGRARPRDWQTLYVDLFGEIAARL